MAQTHTHTNVQDQGKKAANTIKQRFNPTEDEAWNRRLQQWRNTFNIINKDERETRENMK